MTEKTQAGKIGNSGVQVVDALFKPSKAPKPKKKTGKDLRAGRK